MNLKTRINTIYQQLITVEHMQFEIETEQERLSDEHLELKYQDISNPHVVIFRV